jgi:hypothetical protein
MAAPKRSRPSANTASGLCSQVIGGTDNKGGGRALATFYEVMPTRLTRGGGLCELTNMGAFKSRAQRFRLLTERATTIAACKLLATLTVEQATRLRCVDTFKPWLLQQLA